MWEQLISAFISKQIFDYVDILFHCPDWCLKFAINCFFLIISISSRISLINKIAHVEQYVMVKFKNAVVLKILK